MQDGTEAVSGERLRREAGHGPELGRWHPCCRGRALRRLLAGLLPLLVVFGPPAGAAAPLSPAATAAFTATAQAQGQGQVATAPQVLPPMAAAALAATAAAAAAPAYRFRLPPGPAPVTLSSEVLSSEERAFLATLPEVRVALQAVGAPPFERISPQGEILGLQPEMLAALARTFGFRLRPVVLPDWPSVLRAVRDGQADMVLTLAASPERSAFLNFTLGTVSVPVAVMARAAGAGIAEPPPLERGLFALERDYSSHDVVQRRYPQARVLTVDTTHEALRAVATGEADYYLGSLLESIELLAARPVPGIEVRHILQAGAGHYHFGVRKDWAPLVSILNKGITTWRALPEVQAQAAALVASAAASLPAAAQLQPPFKLDAAETAALADRAVWRVGAVRGLTLLNEALPRGGHSGIAADYMEQVALRLGVVVEVVPFDSVAEMLVSLRAGGIDVVPFLTRTAERARQFAYSQPYFEMPYVLVARSDAPLYWDLGSLRGKRLALQQQHPLTEYLVEKYPEIRIVDASTGFGAMDLVAEGAADAAVEVKLFANLRINSDRSDRLRNLGPVGEVPAQFHFATSPAAAALLPLIDRALADIPDSERQRTLMRWVAVDLQPAFPWQRWLPTLVVAGAALLLLAGATVWWMRRLAVEVRHRRRTDELVADISRTLPGVAFRYVLGAKGELVRTFFSANAEAFFGKPPLPGRTVLDQLAEGFRPEQLQRALQAQKASFLSGERFRFDGAYRHPDGRERWLYAEAVRSTTREGQHAWTGYLIDITEQHELQEQLARQADERHVMLASASHELRAPAHTLTLALQAVSPAEVSPLAGQALDAARDAARTIALLLDDVLDAARLDLARLELHPQPLLLQRFVEQVAVAQRPVMTECGLDFQVHCAPDLPATWLADPLRVKQVLTNLLSNAAKYTPRGLVRLSVAPARLPDGRPGLQWQVQDSGVGIPAEQQRRLFQPFVGAPAAPEDAQGRHKAASSGLGLSICRRLVALMEGQISLHSTPGRGTTVTVLLPWTDAPAGRQPLRRDGVLLVCDDDDVSRMLLAASLARLGHSVEQASSGDEALQRWRGGGVRALVTDLHMPGLDGVALMAAIREDEQHKGAAERTAIVVCSGSAPPAAQDAGTARPGAAPYDAYLSKPVDLAALADTLRTLA